MFILDKPYVSDLLIETIKKNNYPILSRSAKEFNISDCNEKSDNIASAEYNTQKHPKIYSNSENAINWISKYLPDTNLPEKINLFKDKIKFRDLTAKMFPKLFYQGIAYDALEKVDVTNFPFPFIVKPSVGFFSMGVYKVDAVNQWSDTLESIKKEMKEVKELYPIEVMDSTAFIFEECIEGKEYAFDAYFNEKGEAIVLGIYEHMFSSGNDVSDRVYFSSKSIINKYLEPFTSFLQEIGDLAGLKNFPAHTEVRINAEGKIMPIEINPMRFGGWCTTADMTTLAYGLNPYECFFNNIKPNWNALLEKKDNVIYSIIILNNSTGIEANKIEAFDYEKLKDDFSNPITLRKVNWNEYPLFGILFAESTKESFHEVENILTSDLKQYVIR